MSHPDYDAEDDPATIAAWVDELRVLDPNSDHDDSYWEVIRSVVANPPEHVFPFGLELCRSRIAGDRSIGADLLRGINGVQLTGLDAAERLEVLVPLLDDPDVDVVEAAAGAIGNLDHPDVLDALASVAAHEESGVRETVVLALSGHDDLAAAELLVLRTRDDDEDVRNWATFVLGQHDADTAEVRTALIERLGDEHRDTRAEAIAALAQRGDTSVTEQLLDMLEAADPDEPLDFPLRHAVVELAQVSGDRRLRRYLRRILADDGEDHPPSVLLYDAIRRSFKPGEPEFELLPRER